MAAGRTLKNLVSRRRRAPGDEEDDDSVTMADDSQSEGSALSDLDDDADGEASDASDGEAVEPTTADAAIATAGEGDKKGKSRSKRSRKSGKAKEQTKLPATQAEQPAFTPSADTEAMMNGLKIAESGTLGEAVDFDSTQAEGATRPAATSEPQQLDARTEPVVDRRKREHEEYKKKRDADPTFIPNRGNFFMHDPRTPDQRGFAPTGRGGRGRGRGVVGGPFSPAAQMAQADKTADAPWTHDLHETLNETDTRPGAPSTRPTETSHPQVMPAADSAARPPNQQARPLNFSRTTHVGNVLLRVFLPGMKAPIPFSAVPVKSHTRLPDHRPPLRRDKPVRVSLPEHTPRYIFPSIDRSFIFIPRALRPNQQGFGGRGGRSSIGGFGGYSSRRTSAYGGSVYAPSVAMSRRSSLAREIGREAAFSPTGSVATRHSVSRPVVRLPQGVPYHSTAASPAGSMSAQGGHFGPQSRPVHSYPPPQQPAVTNYLQDVTMHQPRPQKAVSAPGLESAAGLSLNAPQPQDQQPFQNQIPTHVSNNNASFQSFPAETAPPSFQPQQPYPYQNFSSGTPLPNIPEGAARAPDFQPGMHYGQPAAFYPGYPAGGYYNWIPPQQPVPLFVPQQGYSMPQGTDPSAQEGTQHSQPAGPVAYQSNGMVHYQYAPQNFAGQNYAPMPAQYPAQEPYQGQEGYLQPPGYSYAVPGMGGMPTPSPEGPYNYGQMPGPAAYYAPQQ